MRRAATKQGSPTSRCRPRSSSGAHVSRQRSAAVQAEGAGSSAPWLRVCQRSCAEMPEMTKAVLAEEFVSARHGSDGIVRVDPGCGRARSRVFRACDTIALGEAVTISAGSAPVGGRHEHSRPHDRRCQSVCRPRIGAGPDRAVVCRSGDGIPERKPDERHACLEGGHPTTTAAGARSEGR